MVVMLVQWCTHTQPPCTQSELGSERVACKTSSSHKLAIFFVIGVRGDCTQLYSQILSEVIYTYCGMALYSYMFSVYAQGGNGNARIFLDLIGFFGNSEKEEQNPCISVAVS